MYTSCGVGGGSFVSSADLVAFAEFYKQGDPRADINYDGYVDATDAAIFTSEYPKQVANLCGD